MRWGYAVGVRYDRRRSIHPTLETKPVEGMYFDGQIQWHQPAYEESRGQGSWPNKAALEDSRQAAAGAWIEAPETAAVLLMIWCDKGRR